MKTMHTGGNVEILSRLSKIFLFQNLRFEEYETVIPNQKERDHFSILLLQNKYLGHWTFPSLSPIQNVGVHFVETRCITESKLRPARQSQTQVVEKWGLFRPSLMQ